MADQGGTDTTALPLRDDSERTQRRDLDKSSGRIEQAPAEHDVPDNTVGFIRHQRRHGPVVTTQGIHQVGHTLAMFAAEGTPVDRPHRLVVTGTFFAERHGRDRMRRRRGRQTIKRTTGLRPTPRGVQPPPVPEAMTPGVCEPIGLNL
jgi:hypothetical protein